MEGKRFSFNYHCTCSAGEILWRNTLRPRIKCSLERMQLTPAKTWTLVRLFWKRTKIITKTQNLSSMTTIDVCLLSNILFTYHLDWRTSAWQSLIFLHMGFSPRILLHHGNARENNSLYPLWLYPVEDPLQLCSQTQP